jgi:hypothetical protein
VWKESKSNHYRGKKKMQSHNSDNQCSSEVDTDGRRDAEQRAFETAIGVALAQVLNLGNRQVHLAEAGKTVDLSANMYGSGGLQV